MDLSHLNDQQRDAVLHQNGPCAVIAGAGSGKTRVLVWRIAYLIEEHNVPAGNILAVTFTRKAAGEMIDRLGGLIGGAVEDLHIGTFHSICLRILREEWKALGDRRASYDILNEYWQRRYMKDILGRPGHKNPWGMDWNLDIKAALSFISTQKNNLRGPFSDLVIPADSLIEDWMLPKYKTLYQRYEERKAEEQKLDFDDMLLLCFDLLRDNQAIRAKYQERFRYLLVDEFQDTNLAQYEILKLVAPPENNVFVTGDDDQSLYSWRAARPEFILNFEREWPGAKVLFLSINYRSTSNIVRISNALIANNQVRYPKVLEPHQGTGTDPCTLVALDEDHEAQMVTEEIRSLVQDGRNHGDFAILYRTNAQSRAFEDACIKAGIPYVIIGAAGFYNRKEVKDLVAYLRVIHDPGDEEAVKRVLNVPSRYLGKAFIQQIEAWAARTGMSFYDAMSDCPMKAYQERGARDFLSVIEGARAVADDLHPGQLVQYIRKLANYDVYLQRDEGEGEDADYDRVENLNELASAASKFGSLGDFLFYVEQVTSRPKEDEEGNRDKVQLMSIHRSKGLEFPVVFLVGINQGLLPHRRSIVMGEDGEPLADSVEEERRLCYVGMTRAQVRLYLSHLESYQGKQAEPSMFLAEVGLSPTLVGVGGIERAAS